jgi:catechol 2,3-dioxygenase-like lactoylglutathione lyase family enzyme
MRIRLTSVPINHYDNALAFYTEKLGFVKKKDIDMGPGIRFITVVSAEDPNGPELLLEPNSEYPAMKALRESLVSDGIPITAFEVKDVQEEYERLKTLGVEFTMEPTNMGFLIQATFDDTCGNLIQIYQLTSN